MPRRLCEGRGTQAERHEIELADRVRVGPDPEPDSGVPSDPQELDGRSCRATSQTYGSTPLMQ
jgi:hypothetical protein